MTLKQKRFVKEYIANGGNGTQAALKVYDTEDPHIAQVVASENLSKPVVKESIDDAANKLGLTSSIILDNFKDIAIRNVEKVSADAKLKANIELAKILNLYPGTRHANLNINMKGNIKDLNFTQVKDELKIIDEELNTILDEPIVEDK